MHLIIKGRRYPRICLLVFLIAVGWFGFFPELAYGSQLQSIINYEYYFSFDRGLEVFKDPTDNSDRNITNLSPTFSYVSGSEGNTTDYTLVYSLVRDMSTTDYQRNLTGAFQFGSGQFGLSLNFSSTFLESTNRNDLRNQLSFSYKQNVSLTYSNTSGSMLGSVTNSQAQSIQNAEKSYGNSYSFSLVSAPTTGAVSISQKLDWSKETKQTIFTADYGMGLLSYNFGLSAISDTFDFSAGYWFSTGERTLALVNDNGISTNLYFKLYQSEGGNAELSVSNSNSYSRSEISSYTDSKSRSVGYNFAYNSASSFLALLPLGQRSTLKYIVDIENKSDGNNFDDGKSVPAFSLSRELSVNFNTSDYLGEALGAGSFQYRIKVDDPLSSVTTEHKAYRISDGFGFAFTPPSISSAKFSLNAGYTRNKTASGLNAAQSYSNAEALSGGFSFEPNKLMRLQTTHARTASRDSFTQQESSRDNYAFGFSKSLGSVSFSAGYNLSLENEYSKENDISDIAVYSSSNSYSTGLGYASKKRNFNLKTNFGWNIAASPAVSINRDFSLSSTYKYKLINFRYDFQRSIQTQGDSFAGLPVNSTFAFDVSYTKPKTDNAVSVSYIYADQASFGRDGSINESLSLKAAVKGRISF